MRNSSSMLLAGVCVFLGVCSARADVPASLIPAQYSGESGARGLNIPVPDPSTITSLAIERAITQLRAEQAEKVAALRDIIETRLKALDQANAAALENIHREMTELRVLENEKFGGVALQFKERDTRTEQAAIASTTAINAALQSQKEAVAAQNVANAKEIEKSEAGFTKEIEGLKSLVSATKDSSAQQMANLSSRLDRGEGSTQGSKDNTSLIFLVIGAIVGVGGLVIGIVVLVHRVGNGNGNGNGNGRSGGVAPAAIAVVPISPKP